MGMDIEPSMKGLIGTDQGSRASIRLLPRSLSMFEAVVHAVHRVAPGAAITFNTRPEDSADAAARWLKAG